MKKYVAICLCFVSWAANAGTGMKEIYENLNLSERIVGHQTSTGQAYAFEKGLDLSYVFSCRKILRESGTPAYMCRFDFGSMTQENLKKVYSALPATNLKDTRGAGGLSCRELKRDKEKQIVEYSCLLNSWD